jgi:hypothetical protein
VPELLAAAVLLAGLLGGEVEVLDGDGLDAGSPGPVQEPSEGVAELDVAVVGGAGQVVEEAAGVADRVAVAVEAPGGEAVGVGVDTGSPLRREPRPEGRSG